MNKKVIGGTVATTMPVPDYNQSDERKADYIKNRPFYEDWSLIAEARGNNLTKIIADRDLIEGERLMLELNGTRYSISYLTVDNTGEGYSISDEGHRYDWDGAKTIGFGGGLGQTTAKLYSYTVVKHLEDKFIPTNIARIGDVDTVQSDYNQNDETAKDYIKNRPCYDIEGVLGSVDGINETQIPSPVSVGSELKVTFAVDSGLNFDARIKLQEGVTEYRCCVDCVKVVFSGMWLTVYNVSEEHDLHYTGTITVSRITVKTLAERFIPDNVKQTLLPIKLGENTVEYNGDMNCCSIYADKPYAKGDVIIIKGTLNGVTETCEITMPEVVENGFTDISRDIGVLCGYVSMPGSNHLFFNDGTTGTKIKVYRLETHPNGMVIQHLNEEVENLNETFTEAITELNKKTEHLIEKIGEATIVEGEEENYASIAHTKDFITGDVLVIKATLGGRIEEHEITMIDANESGMTFFDTISDIVGRLSMPSRNHMYFMDGIEGTKIEVYKNVVQSNSNIITEIDTALNNIIEKYGLGGDA